MIIGVPKEIKNRERRVALTPEGAAQLAAAGHEVRIEQGAGEGSDYRDADYNKDGVRILTKAEVWAAQLIIKVKEPQFEEFHFLRPEMCLFTYLHLAAAPELAQTLLAKKVRAIAYETVQTDAGTLPLLAPMSRIAGRVAVQTGARLLQSENGTPFPGKGVLMGGVDGVPPARVVIVGGGNAGKSAASMAKGMGAEVLVLDVNPACVIGLQQIFGEKNIARLLNTKHWPSALDGCDLLIGAALIPGEHAPQLLEAKDMQRMAGGVFIDIAIDQGGISTTSRTTTYADPVYLEADVLHCCLPNLPATVPVSATLALTHATLPYVQKLADMGVETAVADTSLARGVNIWDGRVVHRGLAHAFGIPFSSLSELLASAV